MEPSLGAAVCLICFELRENHIYVPSEAPAKIFSSCTKYLHSTLAQENLKDIQLSDKNQLPLCKNCFDSALELTQLSQQLTTIEKDISDLTVAFSMQVFHRRSQVYKLNQMQGDSASLQNSSTIEFNEACLPPNLFSTKTEDPNINHYNNNHDIVINGLHAKTNIANVKFENGDFPFGNISENSQSLIAKDDEEMQFSEEILEKYCAQPSIEHNHKNLQPPSKITDVTVPGGNGSRKCTNPKNGLQLSMSDLLKSVKMPAIKLERVKTEVAASVVNSDQKKDESRKKMDANLLQNEVFSDPSYAPSSAGGEKLLKCLYCEKTFTRERLRIIHHRSHTGEKPYKCSLCPQKFASESGKKIHERNHTGSNPFKCSYCEKTYHALPNLVIHERVHTGEKPYACSFCDKKFAQPGSLKQHKRIHTGEKPYKCSFCENIYASISTMKYHERTHTGEKPYECSCCKKSFSTMGAVKIHEKNHTGEKPFKCSFCQKRFSALGVLKVHERNHTGERPYKCLYCEKTFKQMSSKNTHQRTHRKKRQSLMCPICNLKCGSLAHLKHHEKMHSATTPILFKCSFCEITFNRNEDLNIHEKTHIRENQSLNDNFIVGI